MRQKHNELLLLGTSSIFSPKFPIFYIFCYGLILKVIFYIQFISLRVQSSPVGSIWLQPFPCNGLLSCRQMHFNELLILFPGFIHDFAQVLCNKRAVGFWILQAALVTSFKGTLLGNADEILITAASLCLLCTLIYIHIF